MTSREKDEPVIFALTTEERTAWRRGLDSLADTMPPRIVWQRIREQAEAEGLMRRPLMRRRGTWYAGGAMAASLLAAVVMLPQIADVRDEVFPTVPESVPNGQNGQNGLTALQALMVESRQLETSLRAMPEEPRVVRVGTAATIGEIEDRIAAIDYQLGDPEVQLTPEEEEIFWRERVRLMKSLVRLRYAQAQRTAF